MTQPPAIEVRPYEAADAATTLDIFQRAIRVTAADYYDPEQVGVWSRVDDLDSWHANRAKAHCLLALVDGVSAGFTEIDDDGYLNMMFVDPDFTRRGVATTLLRAAVALVDPSTPVTARASLAARAFFEANGFETVAEHRPVIRGVALTNYSVELGPRRP